MPALPVQDPPKRGAVVFVRRLLKGHGAALSSLVMRMIGVGAGFALTALVGRFYGPAASAHYAIVTQTALFLSVLAIGGLDLAVMKEFSRAVVSGCKVSLRSFLKVLAQSSGIAIGLSALLLLFGDKALNFVARGEMPKGAALVLCLILIGRTTTRILAAIMRSQRSYISSQAVETALIPVLTILAVVAGLAVTVPEILWATALVGLAVAGVALAVSLRHTSRSDGAMTVSTRALMAFALPLWGGSIAQNFADWYGLATVSAVNGLHDAGLFRMAVQFAGLFSIVAMGLFTTYSAQISEAVQGGDNSAVACIAAGATRIVTVLILPGALIAFAFAEPLLRLVGPEFASGATILRILLVGQVLYCITGPCGLVLAFCGHPRWNLRVNVTAALLLLVIAVPVAKMAGAIGMAVLVATLPTARNLVCFALVLKHEGINVLTGRYRARTAEREA